MRRCPRACPAGCEWPFRPSSQWTPRCAEPGQPEVQHLGVAVIAHHDVFGFDVTVNDTGVVRDAECVGDLSPDRDDQVEALWPANQAPERPPLDEFEDDEASNVGFTDFVDGDDVGMVEGRNGARLLLETPEAREILGEIGRENFERDESLKTRVFSEIHFPHPACA